MDSVWPSAHDHVEALVVRAVDWLRLGIETLGAVVIAVGVVVAFAGLARHALQQGTGSFTAIRLAFARHLILALELQLAADILSTSIAPSWQSIGKLAAIVVIRTALNYFLILEMKSERASLGSDSDAASGKTMSSP